MTKEQRKRLIEELNKRYKGYPIIIEVMGIVERVLSEDGCYHHYEKGRCPHDGCPNHKAFQKKTKLRALNGACEIDNHDKCPGAFENFICTCSCHKKEGEETCCTAKCGVYDCCPCHTPQSPKMPEKITAQSDGIYLSDTIRTWEKINELIDYVRYLESQQKLSAQSSPE